MERTTGSKPNSVAGGNPVHMGRVGPMLRGEEVGSRAWVDTGSAPGRSYKCVEKSDLKYPLIHGQGRQVSEQLPPKIPLQLPTAEAGAPLCYGCGWCLGSAPRPQDVSPSAQGA